MGVNDGGDNDELVHTGVIEERERRARYGNVKGMQRRERKSGNEKEAGREAGYERKCEKKGKREEEGGKEART